MARPPPGCALLLVLLLVGTSAVGTARQPVLAASERLKSLGHKSQSASSRVAALVAKHQAAYDTSRARCKHGEEGVLISVHHETTARAYRQSIQLRIPKDIHDHPTNQFRNTIDTEWEHMRAVHMHSVRPDMLAAMMQHEHTTFVEANCVIKHDLPKVNEMLASVETQLLAGLFEGRYRADNDATVCEHRLDVDMPSVGQSSATVTVAKPATGLPACDGVHDVKVTLPATVTVATNARIGTITIKSEQGAIMQGTYTSDPNGRMRDKITWASDAQNQTNQTIWTKIPGPAYDKNSTIGPISHDGIVERNTAAWTRWNWGLDRIDQRGTKLNNRYNFGNLTGNGTTLYNLDTGVMIAHSDFGGRAIGGYSVGCPDGKQLECLSSWTYEGIIDDEVLARDPDRFAGCSEHGTHTSSTAAGSRYGVAHAARIVAVQVLDCQGTGADAGIIAGLDWTMRHYLASAPRRPAVASLSLGGHRRAKAFDESVKRITLLGMTVVVAAGNDKTDACGGSPADVAEAITVGASMLDQPVVDKGKLLEGVPPVYDKAASFSDLGACIDIWAPGHEILAAVPSYGSLHMTAALSGTSMATPMVAGVVLQILEVFPSFLPNDVMRALYCLSVENALTNADAHTKNYLLQGGSQITHPKMLKLLAQQQEFPDPSTYAVEHKPSLDATKCYRSSSEASS